MSRIDFYTDGAYSSKKQRGGWAFYCPELRIRVCNTELHTTNNRMELIAAIKALEFADESNLIDYKDIVIFSDSAYLVETMNGKFQKKTNIDLWDKLDNLVASMYNHRISFKHIKAHTGEKNGNYTVDLLANLMSQNDK